MRLLPGIGLVLLCEAAVGHAQVTADPELLQEIRSIRAVDNHSHITAVSAPGGDALPPIDWLGRTDFEYPTRLRVDNPEWMRVWESLFGVKVDRLDRDSATQVLKARNALRRARGNGWTLSILDACNIDTALVNAPALGAGQESKRFRLVPHGDAFLYPFGSEAEAPKFEQHALPTTLAEYSEQVVRAAVTRWRADGAVAIKLSLAYSRELDFGASAILDAERIYAAHTKRGTRPPPADYKILQDHLFQVLARAAGDARLPVHIHVGIGAEPYFRIAGSNPLLLEAAVSDPSLRSTDFVLIHGGWPFDRQAGVMLIKPNVYADFSAQTFLRSPRALSETLRAWLTWYPEKVLFGTDAYSDPAAPLAGWEEKLWLSNDTARTALALALTGMLADGEITRERASELARMVLRDNALKLYRMSAASGH